MDEKTLARFWKKVDRNGPVPAHCPEIGQCWLWTAYRDKNGYGKFGIKTKHIVLAHRIAFIASRREQATGACVLHRCDNPSCVNPAHLVSGTMADNSADMVRKGRSPRGAKSGAHRKPECVGRGERHSQAKLSDREVEQIRLQYAGRGKGPTLKEIAERFGVTAAAVGCLIKGRHRRGEAGPRRLEDQRQKLSDADVASIRALYRGRGNGPTLAELGKRFGVTGAMVSAIVLGKNRIASKHEPSTHDHGSPDGTDRQSTAGVARAADPVPAQSIS